MKRRPNSRTAVAAVLFLFLAAAGYALDATVNGWDVPVTGKPGGTAVAGTLSPCTIVSVEQVSGSWARIRSGDLRGWVRTRDIVITEKLFSNLKTPGVVSGKIEFENGKHYLYYASSGKLVRYNVTDRLAESSRPVGDVSSIMASRNGDQFVLEGVLRNGEEIRNYVVCQYSSGRIVTLGSFSGSRVLMEDAKFSGSGRHLAVLYAVDGLYYICVYATDSGAIVASSRRGRQINWVGDVLVMNNTEYFWTADAGAGFPDRDIGYKPDRLLVKVRPDWVVNGRVESRVLDDRVLIRAPGGVLSVTLSDKAAGKTDYRGILLNPEQSLEYGPGGVRNRKTGQPLRVFSGNPPQAEFIAFASTNVIGRSRFEKISTVFLYSENGAEIYRYRSVDEPAAVSDSGILADLSTDKDLMVLSVEDPWKKEFFLIVEKE